MIHQLEPLGLELPEARSRPASRLGWWRQITRAWRGVLTNTRPKLSVEPSRSVPTQDAPTRTRDEDNPKELRSACQ